MIKKGFAKLVALTLTLSCLTACAGSGAGTVASGGSKPAESTTAEAVGSADDQSTQTEGTEEARPAEDAAQTGGTEKALTSEDAAQADAAKDSTQAAADAAANPGDYLVFVKDAETMAPIQNVRLQFCSDSLCQMGKTDENGVAAFHSDPGTYTVHLMKAPDGYVSSTEEFTLDQDTREATYFLEKQETEP